MDPTELDQPCKECSYLTTSQDRRTHVFTDKGYQHTFCQMCYDALQDKEYDQTGIIRTSLWMRRFLDSLAFPQEKRGEITDPLLLEMEELKQLTTAFEFLVWFKGLQEIIRENGGMELISGDLKVLFLCTGGRALMTLSNPAEDSITLITTDELSDRARMGIQGIDATAEVARGLIRQAIDAWGSGIRPTPTSSVFVV